MNSEKISPYLFLIIPMALFSFVLVYPIIENVYLSLTDWDGQREPRFVGFENYIRFLNDPITYVSLFNTLIWIALAIAIPVGLGLTAAVLVDGKKGEGVFKAVLFAPFALSGVVVALIWKFIYDPTYGVLNTILKSVRFENLAQPWLGIPGVNTYFIILANSWSQLGFSLVVFLAGLKTISVDILEAATVDGLSGWQRFRHITFPLLAPFTTVVIAMTILNTLKIFDIIYVMTTGGPFRSSETLAVTMFFDAFSLRQYGYGAAVGTILFAIVVAVTVIYLRYTLRREMKY